MVEEWGVIEKGEGGGEDGGRGERSKREEGGGEDGG